MPQVIELLRQAEIEPPAPDVALLIEREPGFRVFLQNLREFLRRSEFQCNDLITAPGDFWPDVFVDRRLPWLRFSQSGACHVVVVTLLWAGSHFLSSQPHVTAQPPFAHADVVYYSASEELPPLDTRQPDSSRPQKADPEYSAQPIISVPREANNRSQTIVTPPNVQLRQDVALPNVVALTDAPDPLRPIGPAPAIPKSERSRLAPTLERSVVAPPPVVQVASRETLQAPQAVIAPPPTVEATSVRRLGDLNVGRSAVVAPAPQLALDEKRALSNGRAAAVNGQSAQVISPPPTLGVSGRSRSGANMVALNLHPAVGAPPEPPVGNRQGNFAATPEGHHGASGDPGASGGGKTSSSGSGKNSSTGLPSGLYVGKNSSSPSPVAGDRAKNAGLNTVNPRLIASARPPRASLSATQPGSESKLSEEERAVFGERKFYSLSLNMPNLNSAGGSWIIRFAALKTESNSNSYSGAAAAGDTTADNLSAPSATRKVDPAYPLELMRKNLGGTVILYGVIHSDGTVGDVRVLRSVDEQLDRYAGEAIAKWRFQPSMKNGAPVDVEATFWIPFKPARTGSNF